MNKCVSCTHINSLICHSLSSACPNSLVFPENLSLMQNDFVHNSLQNSIGNNIHRQYCAQLQQRLSRRTAYDSKESGCPEQPRESGQGCQRWLELARAVYNLPGLLTRSIHYFWVVILWASWFHCFWFIVSIVLDSLFHCLRFIVSLFVFIVSLLCIVCIIVQKSLFFSVSVFSVFFSVWNSVFSVFSIVCFIVWFHCSIHCFIVFIVWNSLFHCFHCLKFIVFIVFIVRFYCFHCFHCFHLSLFFIVFIVTVSQTNPVWLGR